MPVVTLTKYNSVTRDTYVSENSPTSAGGASTILVVGTSTAADTRRRALLYFDLGLIPNDAIINSATLSLFFSAGSTSVATKVLKVTDDWDNTTTWNTQPAFDPNPYATFSRVINTRNSVEIKNLVQEWVDGTSINKGLMLADVDESAWNTLSNFVSFDYTVDQPTLTIDYTIPSTEKRQVEIIGYGTPQTISNTSITPPLPSGVQQGDLLLLHVVTNNNRTPFFPSGWEIVRNDADRSPFRNIVAKKIAGVSESAPTLTFDTGVYVTASIIALRNAKRIFTHAPSSTGSSTTMTFPSIQGLPVKTLAMLFVGASSANSTTKPLPSYAELYDYGDTNPRIAAKYSYLHERSDYPGSSVTFTNIPNYSAGAVLIIEPISNRPPNTPPPNWPKGTSTTPAIITTSTPTLDWSFLDQDDGNTQSAYQVRIKDVNAGTYVHDTGKVVGSVTDYQVPGGVIVKDKLYSWEVMTWDDSDEPSPWSSPEYFKLLEQAAVGDKFTFGYTGTPQTFTVPGNVTKVKLEAWGAEGGKGYPNSPGGKGGYAFGEYATVPGTTLKVFVGGKGVNQVSSSRFGTPGGWNGGGNGGDGYSYGGAGGGGASDVRVFPFDLASRILVAGGGGGGSASKEGGNAGGLEGHSGEAPSGYQGGGGGTQTAGGVGGHIYGDGTEPPGVNGTNGSLGVGGNGGNNDADSGTKYIGGGAGGGGGYYGGGGGSVNGSGGGGSSYYGDLENAGTLAGVQTGDGLVKITVLEVSNPPTVINRDPGTTDQTAPEGTSPAPLFTWDYSGAFKQEKYRIKIYDTANTLVHDTGDTVSEDKQHQLDNGILDGGKVYGWELIVTDNNGVQCPTQRLYFITSHPPTPPEPTSPVDTYRTGSRPVFVAQIGDDVENDGQKFVLQLADDADFTVNLQELSNATAPVGWEAAPPGGDFAPITGDGVDSSYEGGQIRYTMQDDLVEGKTYYWRMAAIDAASGARGPWSEVRSIRVGNVLKLVRPLLLTGDALAERLLLNLIATVATDGEVPAELKIEATNNGLDDFPVWEDATQAVLSGDYFTFTNTAKTAAEGMVAVRFTVHANDSLGPIEILDFAYSID
jgi:Glycine rich protein